MLFKAMEEKDFSRFSVRHGAEARRSWLYG
jgi:hypothetical protein